jgi:hypothetical protein
MTTYTTPTPPNDLIVISDPSGFDFIEFIGTRAMLEAEGVIPAGTEWPQGYDRAYWTAGKFDYTLVRERPEGAKGPRKLFADCDWWCVRWTLCQRPHPAALAIAAKEKALEDEIYRQSPKGRAEWIARWERFSEAEHDAKFQAFKASIPGLVRPKRGRRAMTAN